MTEDIKQDEARSPLSDIADFDTVAGSEAGAVMEVRNPKTGEVLRHDDGRPFTITFRGPDSEAFRNLMRAQEDRRNAAFLRTRALVLTAVRERDDLEMIVAATLEWDIVFGGKIPPSNSKEYRAAYTQRPWLMRQGQEFLGVDANFIKGNSPR